jgi:hypothetical protein
VVVKKKRGETPKSQQQDHLKEKATIFESTLTFLN